MNILNIIVVSDKVELTSRVHTNTKNRLENAGYDQEGHCFHSLHWDSNVSDCFCHDIILNSPDIYEVSDTMEFSRVSGFPQNRWSNLDIVRDVIIVIQ